MNFKPTALKLIISMICMFMITIYVFVGIIGNASFSGILLFIGIPTFILVYVIWSLFQKKTKK